MLTSTPQTTSGDSHVISHDSDSALTTLSTALRLSIAGETLDQDATELQPSISDIVNHKEPVLVVPDDVPVDLRVKLAVSMIQLGKTVPEVILIRISSRGEDFSRILGGGTNVKATQISGPVNIQQGGWTLPPPPPQIQHCYYNVPFDILLDLCRIIMPYLHLRRICFSRYLLVQKIMVIYIWTLLMLTWKIVSFSLIMHKALINAD